MAEFKKVILDQNTGRYRVAQEGVWPLTQSELIGANSGNRPDLLAHRYKYWLLEGTETLYTSTGTQLVPAVDAATDALGRGVDSPVFVSPGGALVDAIGNPIIVSGGGSVIPQYATYSSLPPSPAVGTLGIVISTTGVYFINRYPAGVYRFNGGSWDYLGEVPDGYFVDNVTVFFDDIDPTKRAKFQLSLIAPSTERTYSFPDKTGTLALTSDTITVSSTPPASPVINQLWLEI